MSVYTRKDSKYYWMHLETAPPGQQDRSTKVVVGVTKEDRKASRALAETIYHQAMLKGATVGHDLPVATAAITFDALATWYDQHVIVTHKGHERERAILPRLRAAFGDLPVTDITKDRVIAWRTTRRSTKTVVAHFGGPHGPKRTLPPPSARTVNREVDLLQQVLEAGVPTHYAVSPLADLPDLPIVEPTRRTMSEAEERALLPHFAPPDRAIVLLGLDGLVRLCDALDLQHSDDHGTTVDIRDPKNGRPHTIPVSTRLRLALDAVPVDPLQPHWFFPTRRGAATERDRRSGFAHALKRACVAADVPYGRAKRGITFHWATRRTGATRMIRALGDGGIAIVQAVGNWKHPDVMIRAYQEQTTAEMRAAVETVAPKGRATLKVLRGRKKAVA